MKAAPLNRLFSAPPQIGVEQAPLRAPAFAELEPVPLKVGIRWSYVGCGKPGNPAKEPIHHSQNHACPPSGSPAGRFTKISDQPARFFRASRGNAGHQLRELLRSKAVEEEMRDD